MKTKITATTGILVSAATYFINYGVDFKYEDNCIFLDDRIKEFAEGFLGTTVGFDLSLFKIEEVADKKKASRVIMERRSDGEQVIQILYK